MKLKKNENRRRFRSFSLEVIKKTLHFLPTSCLGLAREAIAAGCTQAELRATLRHLIVCAGYAGALAATSTLSEAKVRMRTKDGGRKKEREIFSLSLTRFRSKNEKVEQQLLGPATPGKLGGPPSDALGLTYGASGSRAVAARLHSLDPVLAARLRSSVYGDLWADPGVPRSTRQLLMVSFLGEAGMQLELFGHAEAALGCGCSPVELVAAAEEGFLAAARKVDGGEKGGASSSSSSPPFLLEQSRVNYRETMKTLEAAWARHRSRFPEAAAAVKERERKKKKKTSNNSDGDDDNVSSSSLPPPPDVLVAGHDASWWCCVPDLDLEDFAQGAERVPSGRGEEEEEEEEKKEKKKEKKTKKKKTR